MKSPHFEVFFRKQDATGPNRAGASGQTGYRRAHARIAGGPGGRAAGGPAGRMLLVPYYLLLTPCSLLLAPYSLLLTPCSLLLTPYSSFGLI